MRAALACTGNGTARRLARPGTRSPTFCAAAVANLQQHGRGRFTPRHAQGVWCKCGRTPVSPSLYLAFSIKNLCERCDAVCCRLTVMVDPTDRIPQHLTSVTPQGWHVMARDEEGWCVAIDAARMCCSIYETRPAICRRFVMSGPYCRDVRATYDDQRRRGIPLTLYNA